MMGINKKVFKILVTGSFGSGKTTLVKTLSEIDPLLTEKKITHTPEQVWEDKDTTTVAMDMGKIKVSEDVEVHLFSTPGQERFDFMFDILSKGILGALILVDASNPLSVKEAETIAQRIKEHYDIPIVFGVTKTDFEDSKSIEEIRAYLEEDSSKVVTLDPRDLKSSKKALLELLSLILKQ